MKLDPLTEERINLDIIHDAMVEGFECVVIKDCNTTLIEVVGQLLWYLNTRHQDSLYAKVSDNDFIKFNNKWYEVIYATL